jgi:hypothetical protein
MRSWHGWLLTVLMVAGAVVLVGWNSSRFLVAKPQIRAKDLEFLPAPETARVLALGHHNTLAKLRWIDSFAYFQYQLDRRDDRVAGGGSGFRRLYETLITLDPCFEPFYEHAALNLSGVLGHHLAALSFLLRGNLELPQSTPLWRNTIATLKVFFTLDQRQPAQFDALLSAWEEAERDPDAKRLVWDWKRKFGSDTFSGLEQLPYWLAQLDRVALGTPNAQYVEDTIRGILARYGAHELTGLVAAWQIAHGGVPRSRNDLVRNLDLIDPFVPTVEHGPFPRDLAEVLQPALLRRRYPDGPPAYGPVALVDGRPVLRNDPFGMPWRLAGGEVVSDGIHRAQIEREVAVATANLLDLAQRHGAWPATLEEAAALGLPMPRVQGGTLRLDGRQVVVDWAVEAAAPWPLRQGR